MREIGPDDEFPEGFSCLQGTPFYRQYKKAESRLDYTIDQDRIYIDWIVGKDTWELLKAVVDQEGPTIKIVEGYLTAKLEHATDAAIERLGKRIAGKLGRDWKSVIERKEGRRFIAFVKEG